MQFRDGFVDTTIIYCDGSMVWKNGNLSLTRVQLEGLPRPDPRYQEWYFRPWNLPLAWEYFRISHTGELEVHRFCTDDPQCNLISPLGSPNFSFSAISGGGKRCRKGNDARIHYRYTIFKITRYSNYEFNE